MLRKSYLYYLATFSVLLLIFTISSCEKDEINEEQLNQETFPKINGKVSQGFELLNQSIIGDKIRSLSSGLNSKSTTNSSVQIDTSFVNIIETDNYTSYTFAMEQDSLQPLNDVLKNYMLTIHNDTTVLQHLGTYTKLSSGEYDLDNIALERVYGDELLPSFVKCGGIETTWFSYQDCYTVPCNGTTNGEPANHQPGDECFASRRAYVNCTTRWASISTAEEPCGGSGGGTTRPSGGGGIRVPVVPVDPNRFITISPESQNYFDNYLPSDLSLYINDPNRIALKEEIHIFLTLEGFTVENKELVKDFLEIRKSNELIKLDRFIELVELIENDPFVLIEDCLAQSGLGTQDYIDLYNLYIPSSCVNRLMNLGGITGGYITQPIWRGNVPLANIDYYGVEITTMPDINMDGNPDTASEVFDAYKDNFLNFASGSQDDFQFASNIPLDLDNQADISWEFSPLIDPDDINTFNSTNPITAILKIIGDASVVAGWSADSGAVIVSDYQPNYQWTVSTIQTPETGSQPFSGNRQWGVITNDQGYVELFTRAVDVAKMSSLIESDFRNDISDKQTDYYYIANATWENLQSEVIAWIYQNGGEASNSLDSMDIKVDKYKIKELLEGSTRIDEINCN